MTISPIRIAAALVACTACGQPAATTSSGTQYINGFEGMFEFAIDLPWRIEPRAYTTGGAQWDSVPITIAIFDEDTNHYSADGKNLWSFCKLEVQRLRDGVLSAPETFDLADLDWIERTGPDPAHLWWPTYWQLSGTDPHNATCFPGTSDCTSFASIRNTSEWHAQVRWNPGTVPVDLHETLKLTAYVSGVDEDGCDEHPIALVNYARAFWSVQKLPRFDDNWLYGDLHYHSQSTDNEGESGYSYRAVTSAMGAMGIDFTFATDHASNSEQIVDIDGFDLTEAPDMEKRGARDLTPARWTWAEKHLYDAGGVNDQIAASWQVGRPRVPRLFLGAEVDARPEVTVAPTALPPYTPGWLLGYGNGRTLDLAAVMADGWNDTLDEIEEFPFGNVDPIMLETLPILFEPGTDLDGNTRYLLSDIQGPNKYGGSRQHVLYLPRYRDKGLVASNTSEFGGGRRSVMEPIGGAPEGLLVEIQRKNGIAFLAHPLSGGGGGEGPAMVPYTDYQYAKMFRQRSFVGLQFWNENRRLSSSKDHHEGDFDVSGWTYASATTEGTHAHGWDAKRYELTPMYDLANWQWQRMHFGLEESLHNGAFVWDKLLRWGLDLGRTRAIGWAEEPRKLFMAGGSDGHGDFNYRREGYATATSETNDTAFAKVRNLVHAGAPRGACAEQDPKCSTDPDPEPSSTHSQDQIVDALAGGKFAVTDGPAVRLVVDRNRNQVIDDGDYEMGSTVDLYNYEALPIIVEWRSTVEFGPVDKVDLYVGVDTEPCIGTGPCTMPPDESRARTYASYGHGTRRESWQTSDEYQDDDPEPASTADPYGVPCGSGVCKMADNYWMPAEGPARDRLRHLPSIVMGEGLYGTYATTISFDSYPTAGRAPTRGYVRAFIRTRRDGCDMTPASGTQRFGGECVPRYAFANPVWALRHTWQTGTPCPTTPRGLDKDYDGYPDLCDGNPDSPANSGWSRIFGGGHYDHASAVAFDNVGSVFVAGVVQTSGAIENDANVTTPYTASAKDALVLRYNVLGVKQAQLLSSGTGSLTITDMITDASNNVYIAGTIAGTNTLGGVALDATTDTDAFVAKLAGSNLAVQWTRRFTGAGETVAKKLALAPGGLVVVAGHFTGTLTVPIGVSRNFTSEGQNDCFVGRLSATGAVSNVTTVRGTGDCQATGLAVDTHDRAFLAVTYGGALRVGSILRTSNSHDSAIIRGGTAAQSYAPQQTTWLGDPTDTYANVAIADIALADDAKVRVVGDYHGTLSTALDAAPFTVLSNLFASHDGFLVDVSTSTGAPTLPPIWRFGGTTGDDALTAVAFNDEGQTILAGNFKSTSITTPAGTFYLQGAMRGMVFVLDDAGAIAWQRAYGWTGYNYPTSAAVSSDGRLAFSSSFEGAQIDDLRYLTPVDNSDGAVSVFRTP